MSAISKKDYDAGDMVESIIGCKWSVAVLDAIAADVCRPSDIQRACEGVSTKVLNERLRKLLRFGLVDKHIYPESPPRVEYRLTVIGKKFLPVLEAVRDLQCELDQADDNP